MSSADKLKSFFKKAELHINSDSDEKIFQDVFGAHQKTIKSETAQPVHIERIIIKSHLTKIAAAAVVIIACMAGLMMFKQTSRIALANVLTQIKKFDAYMFQIDMTATRQIARDTWVDQDLQHTMLISQEYGFKVNRYKLDPNNTGNISQQETYILPQKKIAIIIGHTQKMYQQTEINATYIEQIKKQYDPHMMIEQILECQYQNLGRSTIDGIKVEGFQTTDPNYEGGRYSSGKVDIKLWVDVETQLPVRIEKDIQFVKQAQQVNISQHEVKYDFQWDVPVDAADFEPNIPEDYTLISE